MPMPIPPSKTKTGTSPLTPNRIPNTVLSNPKHRANTPARRTTIIVTDISESSTRDSSGQVWVEDCCSADIGGPNLGGREDLGLPSPPPAATLTSRPFPKSVPLSAEEESYPARQPRSHQRSLTALLPFRTTTIGPESPTKVDIEGDFMAPLTGDTEGVIRVADKRGGLSSWFTGSSAPVTVGVLSMEPETTNISREASPQRPAARLQKRPTESPTALPRINTGGMFNFFLPKAPTKTTVQVPAELNDDELFTLDVRAALFPNGEPTEQDPFSPSAFKNLLMNAEGLLLRLQTAYKLRTISLNGLSAEKEAMSEELEEADTRAKYLKNQLDDLSHQMSLKDSSIAELAAELAAEKQARAEEKHAREQSIALDRAERDSKRGSNSNISIDTTGEDLDISDRRRNRISGVSSSLSTNGDSGSDFEADSIFSRPRSPTFTISSASVAVTTDSTPEIAQANFARVVPNPGQNPGRPKMTPQRSTFQKIISGMGSAAVEVDRERDPHEGIGMGEQGCSNCLGKDASVAWDTVGLMRAENKGLKERVGYLEAAVEGALDLCDRLA